MKNILAIMEEYGFEVPEEKKKDFEKAVLDNYKTVADYEKQTEKLSKANDTIKANDDAMKDLQSKIEEFKDVDVSALNNRIKELETEKSTIESDYQSKLADRDFNDILKDGITSVGGRNAKAITALLDLEALKSSKNQKEDVANALKALTEADDSKMLFGETEPQPKGNITPIGVVTNSGPTEDDAAMRQAMGLPPVKKGE